MDEQKPLLKMRALNKPTAGERVHDPCDGRFGRRMLQDPAAAETARDMTMPALAGEVDETVMKDMKVGFGGYPCHECLVCKAYYL